MPDDEETAKFRKYHFLKEVSDDAAIFTHIARITDAMLKRVDPTNSVLIEYMTTVDPRIETRKLLSKEDAGPSKKSRKSMKAVIITREQTVQEPKKIKSPKKPTKQYDQVSTVLVKPVEPVVKEPTSIIITSMFGVF